MIRILHTADWHVGKKLRGRSRADEHRAVLHEIAAIARDNHVDAVLVGGDLFDTSAPSAEAEEIVYTALMELAATGAHVVVISGNHDNPLRLDAVAPLLALTGVHVQTGFRAPDDGGVLRIAAASGERLNVGLLPFLSKRHVVRAAELMDEDAAEHNQTYAERMKHVVELLCSELDPGAVNVLLAHATIYNATLGKPLLGGGERLAHTVFEYNVTANIFPSALQYVALGHLHRCQQIDAGCRVHYCGSPLQLDFGETADAKQVLLIEASPGLPAQVTGIPLESGRRLRTICHSMSELRELEGTTGDDFLKVVVAESHRVGLADEVRAMFADAVDVVVEDPAAAEASHETVSRADRSPHLLFTAYLEERHESDAAVIALFDELLEEASAPAAT